MGQKIVDREPEKVKLRRLAKLKTPRLVLLYGRRRVGKTHLLTNLWDSRRVFYFTASATTSEQNRRQLIMEASEWSGETLQPEDYPTWRTVFRLMLGLRPGRLLILVLDEFQYLGETPADLARVTSELNAAWEGLRNPRRSLLFVISGSSVATLEALDRGGAPLYGRFAWKAQLQPFDYLDAGKMASFESLRDRACTYGIFGGMPRYLAPVNARHSLAQNVADLMLSPRGEVRIQVETALLQEQGLRDIPKYTAILRAIGAGRTDLNEIAQRAGLLNDSPLRDKVERLVGLGFVEKKRNLGAKRTSPYRYRLADPAFMFYHQFVARLETALEVNEPMEVWKDHLSSQLDQYMGHLFERIAEQAYQRLRKQKKLPLIKEWGRWEGAGRDGDSLEIDLAAYLTDGRVLTGGVKWNNEPLEARWHFHHLAAIERLAVAGVEWAHAAKQEDSPLIYVAAGGFTRSFEDAARVSRQQVILWSLKDLYPYSAEEV